MKSIFCVFILTTITVCVSAQIATNYYSDINKPYKFITSAEEFKNSTFNTYYTSNKETDHPDLRVLKYGNVIRASEKG